MLAPKGRAQISRELTWTAEALPALILATVRTICFIAVLSVMVTG
jgi:hypothetical protein